MMTSVPWSSSRRALLAALGGLAALPSPLAAAAPARPVSARTASRPLAIAPAVIRTGDALLDTLAFTDPSRNRLLSPWSITAASGLAGLGAEGRTAAEAAAALKIGDGQAGLAEALRQARLALVDAASGAELRIMHAAWVRSGSQIDADWMRRIRAALNATAKPINFASPRAEQTINEWVARATRRQIPRIVEDLGSDTDFVLASAVYFAGKWATPFDPGLTRPAPFRAAGGGSTDVSMMSGKVSAGYGRKGPGHVLRLPYAGGHMTLTLATALRPEDGGTFLAELRKTGTAAWIDGVPLQTQQVQVRLPRLRFDSEADLRQPLEKTPLGPWVAPGANLRGIIGRDVQVSAVLHRARIAIDEAGTVASAATAAVGVRSLELNQIEFSADHPFVFVLSPAEPSLPLFAGYVGDAGHAQA